MSTLPPERFDDFFHAVYGRDPFPWQSRLARSVAAGEDWPEALALPTASGKTACIPVAVYALACQATEAATERHAPRRIFFVVDRRVIVDEAYQQARRLRDALAGASGGILAEVAGRLRALARPGEASPLAVFQLRGGVYRDDAWAKTPTQPTVVATTVDQLGSRLLFRSYGRSHKAWPLHAGLAGNDALVLLDEAHCAQPFLETLRAVRRYRDWAERPLAVPFQLAILSATPPPGVTRVFALDAADRAHPVLRARLGASKLARLRVVEPARGRKGTAVFAAALAEEGAALAAEGCRRVGIIVNRVETAWRIHRQLEEAGHEAVLLTGRMRPLDREDLLAGWRPRDAQGEPRGLLAWVGVEPRGALERPVFVVATQTLEVGANLDFDALVTECASLDALRQRFGRLDRLGTRQQSRAVIAIRGDQQSAPREGEEDPIYGAALQATWSWLLARARDGLVDFGIEALDRPLAEGGSEQEALRVPVAPAPVMLPAHLDVLAQTAPPPLPEPAVPLFLHGPRRGAAEVQICWRSDLPNAGGSAAMARAWIDLLSLAPPASVECLTVPRHLFLRWLAGEPQLGELADVEGAGAANEEAAGDTAKPPESPPILRWLGPEESQLVTSPRDVRPGDTLVIASMHAIPAELGGAAVGAGADRGDEAQLVARRRVLLRLHPALLAGWPPGDATDQLRRLVTAADLPDRLDGELRAEVLAELREVAAHPQCAAWLRETIGHLLRQPRAVRVQLHPGGWVQGSGELRPPGPAPGGLVLSLPGRLAGLTGEDTGETFSHEDESASGGAVVGLRDHCDRVAARAGGYARAIGLPDRLIHDLELAGHLHDLGKADFRFQAWLHDGNAFAAHARGELLAKSPGLPRGRRERETARRRAGYPAGGRHELCSLRLVEAAPEVLGLASDPELLLHLVAAHHGWCRPFAPVVLDPDGPPVEVVFRGHTLQAAAVDELADAGSGVAERFWALVRRYGWWGLALLEGLLILADHRCSAEDEEPVALPSAPPPMEATA